MYEPYMFRPVARLYGFFLAYLAVTSWTSCMQRPGELCSALPGTPSTACEYLSGREQTELTDLVWRDEAYYVPRVGPIIDAFT